MALLREIIGNVSSVTHMTLEMNFLTFCNIDTLSKAVSISPQITLDKVQMFLNLNT